ELAHLVAVDRLCRAPQPIERRFAFVVASTGGGAVLEQHVDGLFEPRLGGGVQGGGAGRGLAGVSLVIDVRTSAKQPADVFGVVLSALIAGAREADPAAAPLYASAAPAEQRRELGVQHPAARADPCRVCTVFEQKRDHRDARALRGGGECA